MSIALRAKLLDLGAGAILTLLLLASCSSDPKRLAPMAPALDNYASMAGNLQPVHDPAIMRQGSTWYVFSTDARQRPAAGYLPIRCADASASDWRICGMVFSTIPAWVREAVPGVNLLWAPDVSYFNGLYHVYYAGSTLGSQRSVIGLATSATLDPGDPAYRWVDQGEVLRSLPGDDFNAIDPNILVDTDSRVWLNYGSYWRGIKQREINPRTGKLLQPDTQKDRRYDLARRPKVKNDPLEGASMVRHGGFHYLFVSIDYCCNRDLADDNYKEAVGRSTSPHGPFVDQRGTPMMKGGGTILLSGEGRWQAPGGATAWIDPASGDAVLVFHALDMSRRGITCLWMKRLTWTNDWPVLAPFQ